jgi:hypothetical protein
MNFPLRIVVLLISVTVGTSANADYRSASGSKEAAIKRSGAYRQEFDRRMSGKTGFENTAAGLQQLQSLFQGPPGRLERNPGKSLEAYMADSVIYSLEHGKSIQSFVTKGTDIIEIIDKYIDEAKKDDELIGNIRDARDGYLWKAQFYMGIRDPGFVEKDLKSAYKNLIKAQDWDRKKIEAENIDRPKSSQSTSSDDVSLQIKNYIALSKLAGSGTSVDATGAVAYFKEIAAYADAYTNSVGIQYDRDIIFNSLCSLINIYAMGANGIEKDLGKVDEYAVKTAGIYLIFSKDYGYKADGIMWEHAKPFIQINLDEMNQVADATAETKTKSSSN